MRRRRASSSICLATCLATCLAICLACGRGTKPPEKVRRELAGAAKGWNVVVVTVDTLRADRLGAYGYKARPERHAGMDAQLGSGRHLRERHGAAGLHLAVAGFAADRPLSERPRRGRERLRLSGRPADPAQDAHRAPATGPGAFLSNMCQANHQGWDDFACAGGQDGKNVAAPSNGRRVDDGRPFFLWVHLFGAHRPTTTAATLAERARPRLHGTAGAQEARARRGDDDGRSPSRPRRPAPERPLRRRRPGERPPGGALLEGLRAAGRLDRTIVIFAADHGEELYQHNRYLYHSCSVYQTTLHVPLGISAPGLIAAGGAGAADGRADRRAPHPAGPPGAAEAGRAARPVAGRPTWSARARGGAGKPAFSEYGEHLSTPCSRTAGSWSTTRTASRPVCIPDAPPDHYPIGRQELYDLAATRGETRNLAAEQPARVAELAQLIRQRFAGLRNRGAAAGRAGGAEEGAQVAGVRRALSRQGKKAC